MKTSIILILASLLTVYTHAQNAISWIGGTPGKETAWNEPRNWDTNNVPGEDDKVIILYKNNGHFAQPVIDSDVEVTWIEIHNAATLTIGELGRLTVDGTYNYSEGISIYGGELNSTGEIFLKGIESEFIAELSPVCQTNKISYYSEMFDYEFCVVSVNESKECLIQFNK